MPCPRLVAGPAILSLPAYVASLRRSHSCFDRDCVFGRLGFRAFNFGKLHSSSLFLGLSDGGNLDTSGEFWQGREEIVSRQFTEGFRKEVEH